MNTIGLIRTSTKGQNVDVQKHELREFASERGYDIIDWVVMEGLSAYGGPPQPIEDLVKRLERQRYPDAVNIFLFSDVDRFSRDVTEGLKLLERIVALDIQMVFVREPQLDLSTPEGKHLFRMKLSQAELESDKIGERVVAANIRKRFLGLQIGPSPYGYRTERGQQQTNPEETAILVILMMFYGNYQVGQILDFIYNYHRTFRPDLIQNEYAIYHGTELQPRDQIYYGTLADFANLMNVYGLWKRGHEWTPQMVDYAYKTYIEPRLDTLKPLAPEEVEEPVVISEVPNLEVGSMMCD